MLFRFVQVVLGLGFSAGILFLVALFLKEWLGRRQLSRLLVRMSNELPSGDPLDSLMGIFEASGILIMTRHRDALKLVSARWTPALRKGLRLSSAVIQRELRAIDAAMQQYDLRTAIVPGHVLARIFGQERSWKRRSLLVFVFTGRGPERTAVVLLMPRSTHLPDEAQMESFRHRVSKALPSSSPGPDVSPGVGLRGELNLMRAEAESRRLAMLRIAHDIRIPVSSLLLIRDNLGAEWARIRERLPEPEIHMDGLLNRLKQQTANLDLLVTNFLGLETGHLHAGPVEEIDLGMLWMSLLDAHGEEFKKKRLHLRVQSEPGMHLTRAARSQVFRILANLLSNAIKFSRPAGTIWTSVQSEGGLCSLELEDCGPGIPEQHQDAYFDLASQNLGRGGGGYGLGLAAARKLAESLQGSLASVPPLRGTGARFLLVLPAGR